MSPQLPHKPSYLHLPREDPDGGLRASFLQENELVKNGFLQYLKPNKWNSMKISYTEENPNAPDRKIISDPFFYKG